MNSSFIDGDMLRVLHVFIIRFNSFVSWVQLPSITDYNVSTNGLTYRYTKPGNVLFPFGFGLSYTQFSYGNLQVTPTQPSKCQQVKVQVEVTNKGHFDADEVSFVKFSTKTCDLPFLLGYFFVVCYCIPFFYTPAKTNFFIEHSVFSSAPKVFCIALGPGISGY